MPDESSRTEKLRTGLMPWRWRRNGWSAATALLIVWLMIYAVLFPPMFLWLNKNTIQPLWLREALWGLYAPMDWLTEHSDGAFALYLWEIETLRASPGLRWLLPAPEPLSNLAPVGPPAVNP